MILYYIILYYIILYHIVILLLLLLLLLFFFFFLLLLLLLFLILLLLWLLLLLLLFLFVFVFIYIILFILLYHYYYHITPEHLTFITWWPQEKLGEAQEKPGDLGELGEVSCVFRQQSTTHINNRIWWKVTPKSKDLKKSSRKIRDHPKMSKSGGKNGRTITPQTLFLSKNLWGTPGKPLGPPGPRGPNY